MVRAFSLAGVFPVLYLAQPALAGEPTPVPCPRTPQAHQVVDHAIRYLQTESAAWLNTRKYSRPSWLKALRIYVI